MWWVLFIILFFLIVSAWGRYDYSQGLKQLREERVPTISKHSFSETMLLTTGEDFLDQLLDDVLKAKKHVHIQFYIFRSDQTGKRVIDSLCKKAEEGVEVRLLVDRFGCKLSHSLKKKLSSAGVDFYCSATLKRPYFFFSLNRRNHRKLAIIDGKISYIGGFNVGDEYLGRNPFFGFWRDFHLRITGEGSALVQEQFLQDFKAVSRTKLPNRDSFFPKLEQGTQPLQFLSTSGVGLERQLITMIEHATHSLIICTPYYIPSKQLHQAVLDASQRGINVSLILPEKADHPLVKHGATPFVMEAIRAGVLVYHYYRGFYHVKAIIADKNDCLLGTPNFDRRSLHLNDEMSCISKDPSFINQVLSVVNYDLSISTNVTLEKLEHRPILDKIKERIAAPFAGLL